MGVHLATVEDRRIIIDTAQRDDQKYYVRSVRLEVSRPDGSIDVDEVPYLDSAHSDESLVVEKALEDVSRRVTWLGDDSPP